MDQGQRTVELIITSTMLAGAMPVQTGIPFATPISIPISTSLQENNIGSSAPKLM
jgi:hypothetical protein